MTSHPDSTAARAGDKLPPPGSRGGPKSENFNTAIAIDAVGMTFQPPSHARRREEP
jgi:hypothetical protein